MDQEIRYSGKRIVLSAVYDLGATSRCIMDNSEFILTYEPSNKVFHIKTITIVKASVNPKMHHNPQKPARMVDMVPVLQHNALITASKFADAYCWAIFYNQARQ